MAKAAAQTSPTKTVDPNDDQYDAVAAVLKDNPDVAEELANLTRGEQIIRLRQRGLLDFDVQ